MSSKSHWDELSCAMRIGSTQLIGRDSSTGLQSACAAAASNSSATTQNQHIAALRPQSRRPSAARPVSHRVSPSDIATKTLPHSTGEQDHSSVSDSTSISIKASVSTGNILTLNGNLAATSFSAVRAGAGLSVVEPQLSHSPPSVPYTSFSRSNGTIITNGTQSSPSQKLCGNQENTVGSRLASPERNPPFSSAGWTQEATGIFR